jgi:hypothetical protein
VRTHVSVEVPDILSLIHCAQDYGHGNNIFMDAMAGMLDRRLDDEEIRAYADNFMAPEMIAKGYGEEDRDNALETLREFKLRYIGGECNVAVDEDTAEETDDEPVGVSPPERARILGGDWKFVGRKKA